MVELRALERGFRAGCEFILGTSFVCAAKSAPTNNNARKNQTPPTSSIIFIIPAPFVCRREPRVVSQNTAVVSIGVLLSPRADASKGGMARAATATGQRKAATRVARLARAQWSRLVAKPARLIPEFHFPTIATGFIGLGFGASAR